MAEISKLYVDRGENRGDMSVMIALAGVEN